MLISRDLRIRMTAAAARVRHKSARLLGGGRLVELRDLPHEILYPARTVHAPVPVVLPGELDKIEKLGFRGLVRDEIESIATGTRKIGPTLRVVLKNACIGYGHVYTGAIAHWMSSTQAPSEPIVGEFTSAACRSSRVGCHYFGHWLRDDAATHIMASAEHAPIGLRSPGWPDKGHYKHLFGQQFTEFDFAYVGELIIYDDISQNAHKAERLAQLRVAARRKVAGQAKGHVCYLQRGAGGKARSYGNEQEVLDRLRAEGVTVVQAESRDAAQVLGELMGARLVVSVEGSQLSHALLALDEGGGVLTIQPPDRFWNSHFDWACALGMGYGIVVLDKTDRGPVVNVDRLLATIDEMLRGR
ncbi:glycosyltransferase 61 family protein [Sphingomonas hankyongi]|uniref:Glycosyltransferase 61 family protein n=1 Tax=Sphingomonas hankyongi TaxID=2908209 RepID=A0ABT0S2U7_9SPHN|nr:glycosyltransferase 61 family protein [Sphingomonas hankyongi]MCL6730122.1 glycosyltransferase 61 family protein [Sphingomonas hankyongi]